MRLALILLIIGACFQYSFAALINKTLFINYDSLTTVNGATFPYLAFNETAVFNQRNATIVINEGDSLALTLINNHSKTHRFKVKNHTEPYLEVLAGDTVLNIYAFTTAGLYIYYDLLDFPSNTYLGLAGEIVVKDHSHKSFYWNLKEHQAAYNFDISNNVNVDWSQYIPDYFTVNSFSNPDIDSDPTSRITGKVGDTIIIYMVNTGQSIHSIHFHGFHAEILNSSEGPVHLGRSKDTFPLYSMGSLILRLIPDKPGIYPLHNHNLVAVTANRIYPNGMFSTILISP